MIRNLEREPGTKDLYLILRNEGESILDAFELPTNSIISKNEGKSE